MATQPSEQRAVGPLIPFLVLEYVFPQATLHWSRRDYRGPFGDDGIFYFMHFFLECSSSCHDLHLLKPKPLFNVLKLLCPYTSDNIRSNKRVTFAERSLLDLEERAWDTQSHLTSPHSCDVHVIYHLSSVNHEMRWRGLRQTVLCLKSQSW